MGFGTQPSAAPVYNAPNLAPLLDFQLVNLASDSFGKLPSVTTAPYAYYLPLLGDRALFSPINNITSTVRLLQLTDYSQYALAAEPANCGGSMPTVPVNGRYIYMPQGFSASGVRGSAFYRYDPQTDAWATMAAITTLNAAYRFDNSNGVVWDGGDYIYVFGGYDGTVKATFRYSISGNAWAELADFPLGAYAPAGGTEGPIDGYVYVLRHGGTVTFYRYKIADDTWEALADAPVANAYAGLVQDPANPDLLYAIGGTGGVGAVHRYSISGNAWTTLTGTNIPGEMQGKGIFLTTPTPCILQYRRTTTQMWVYKI